MTAIHRSTTVELGAHLAAACFLMRRAGDSALDVTVDGDSRAPVAVITASDIARAVSDGRDLEATRISDLLHPRRPLPR